MTYFPTLTDSSKQTGHLPGRLMTPRHTTSSHSLYLRSNFIVFFCLYISIFSGLDFYWFTFFSNHICHFSFILLQLLFFFPSFSRLHSIPTELHKSFLFFLDSNLQVYNIRSSYVMYSSEETIICIINFLRQNCSF